MENVVSNNISNSNISRNVNIKNNLSQTNTQLLGSGANLMPTERQTSIGVYSPGSVTKSNMSLILPIQIQTIFNHSYTQFLCHILLSFF